MTLNPSLGRAQWRDLDLIVDLVTASVRPAAVGAWLVPDERQRTRVLAAVARIWTEHALLFGDVFLLNGGTAAAVWFHRYRPIPPPPRYLTRLTAAAGTFRDRFLRLDRTVSAHRPAQAHNHLALLAVPPGPDEDERADAVLTGSQRWMDTLGLPTYAETLTTAGRDRYQRHGYALRDCFTLANGMIVHGLWQLSPHRAGRLGGNAAAHWSRPPRPAANDRVSGFAPR